LKELILTKNDEEKIRHLYTEEDYPGTYLAYLFNCPPHKIWHVLQSNGTRNLERINLQLRKIFIEIDEVGDKLKLPSNVIERTKEIYGLAVDAGLLKNRVSTSFIAASLFIACRENHIPFTMRDSANIMNIRINNMYRIYTILFNNLEMMNPPAFDIMEYLKKVMGRVKLKEKTKQLAINMLNKMLLVEYNGTPLVLVAAILYLSCKHSGEKITYAEIEKFIGSTEQYTRACIKKIEKVVLN